jgi:hypothetical protein
MSALRYRDGGGASQAAVRCRNSQEAAAKAPIKMTAQ